MEGHGPLGMLLPCLMGNPALLRIVQWWFLLMFVCGIGGMSADYT
jgi:hypothetical protein